VNDVLVKQIGNFDYPPAITWNAMHMITFDPILLKETNTLKIVMNCIYDAGIHIKPFIDDYEDVSMGLFFNFLNRHIYMVAFGGGVVIGITLLIVGISFRDLKRAYVFMALAVICAGIHLFDFQLGASTGS
jgi:3-dehydroquinate synthetase